MSIYTYTYLHVGNDVWTPSLQFCTYEYDEVSATSAGNDGLDDGHNVFWIGYFSVTEIL